MTTSTKTSRKAPNSSRARGGSRRPPPRTHYSARPSATAQAGEPVTTRDGRTLLFRTIRPDDVAALQRGFAHLSREEIRLRFLHPLSELPDALAQRLCDLDPAVAIAFVLTDPDASAEPEIHAVARAHLDPATEQAEFGLVVQKHLTGQGLGTLLMNRLIVAARTLGATELWGDTLVENDAMLRLCDNLGFRRSFVPHDSGLVRMTLAL